jgi:hypothetical protein
VLLDTLPTCLALLCIANSDPKTATWRNLRNATDSITVLWVETIIGYLTYLLHGAESFLRSWLFVASQEIPRVLCNPKFPHRTHKRPPPVPILSQTNPVLIPTSHFLKIHSNIILPSAPGSPQRSHSLRFLTGNRKDKQLNLHSTTPLYK